VTRKIDLYCSFSLFLMLGGLTDVMLQISEDRDEYSQNLYQKFSPKSFMKSSSPSTKPVSFFPLTTVVFGDLIDTFALWTQTQNDPNFVNAITPDELISAIAVSVRFFLYLVAGTFVATYIFMCVFISTSELISHRVRKEYLRGVLRQDTSWFDSSGAGEVATRITSDTLLIQDGIHFPKLNY
jgi:ABC-type multidrug transport system fused ATPase/permease subunit